MTDDGRKENPPETRAARRLGEYIKRYGPGRPLDPERLLEIRLRIAGGFYNRPAVRLKAAERLLKSGDVAAPDMPPD